MHNLPEKIGVTANLTVNYRAPTRADQVTLPGRTQKFQLIELFRLL